jgi:hypothetical protein
MHKQVTVANWIITPPKVPMIYNGFFFWSKAEMQFRR